MGRVKQDILVRSPGIWADAPTLDVERQSDRVLRERDCQLLSAN